MRWSQTRSVWPRDVEQKVVAVVVVVVFWGLWVCVTSLSVKKSGFHPHKSAGRHTRRRFTERS